MSMHAAQPPSAEEDIFMMLHFGKDAVKSAANCQTELSPALPFSGHIPTPGCQCVNCLAASASNVHSASIKHQLRPHSMSVIEDGSPLLKTDCRNCIKVAGMERSLKPSSDSGMYADSSYVRFAKSEADLSPLEGNHEYCYPTVASQNPTRGGTTVTRLDTFQPPSTLPASAQNISSRRNVAGVRRTRPRVQCVYCCELFDPELNKRHQKCRDAPDRVMDRINFASCAFVADGVTYHCFSDSEGEFTPACSCSGLSGRSVCKWTVLILLSLFLPCLCCFWPLIGCRRCAERCGYCIPQHRSA